MRVPTVHRALRTRRVLVQERFDGVTVTHVDGLPQEHRDELARRLLATTIDQIMRLGDFHADPHPGHVFALDDGSLGSIDFGAVGRLGPIDQRAIVDMFIALSSRYVSLLREGVVQLTGGTEVASEDELERALGRLMAEHVRPGGGTIDPAVMQELVVTLSRLGLRLPTNVVLLSRALVTVDGTMRQLCPTMTLMSAMVELMQPSSSHAPVIDRNALVKEELLATLPHLRRLPERVDRLLTLAGRGELRVRSVTDEDGRASFARSSTERCWQGSGPRRWPCRARRSLPPTTGPRSARMPASTRSSATAACSAAPCWCCASLARWRGTARRDVAETAPPAVGGVDRRSDRAIRCSPPSHRATATSDTQATCCAWWRGRSARSPSSP